MNFRFRNFRVYQEAKKLHIDIVRLTRGFDRDFDYLVRQIRRSSLSVLLNIAEGSAKSSDRDFNRYLENAMGSVNETVAALEVAAQLKLIRQDEFLDLEARYAQVVKQLGGFSKKLKAS